MVMLKLISLFVVSASVNASAETLSNLHINSTDLVIDREKMIATFTGSVVLCFEDVKLLGDAIVFHFKDAKIKDIQEIHVHKNVKAIERDDTILLADDAVFDMEKSELKLRGNVVIEKGEKIMKAGEMIYYGKISNMVLGK